MLQKRFDYLPSHELYSRVLEEKKTIMRMLGIGKENPEPDDSFVRKTIEIREITSPHHPAKRGSDPDECCFGLFAKEDLEMGTWLCPYLGEIRFESEVNEEDFRLSTARLYDTKFSFLFSSSTVFCLSRRMMKIESFNSKFMIDSSFYSNCAVFVNGKLVLFSVEDDVYFEVVQILLIVFIRDFQMLRFSRSLWMIGHMFF